MTFIEIAIDNLDDETAQRVSELFDQHGHGGAVAEAYPPNFDRSTVRTVIPADDSARRAQIELGLALLDKSVPTGLPAPRMTTIGEHDWVESWKENFQVVRIGQRFVIKPSWRTHEPQPHDLIIEIDPGAAFGTGLHATTQLCLTILEQLPLTDTDLFDVGTGTGILAIAARRLGARTIRAVDVDDIAVRVAAENLARNGVTTHLETAVGSAQDNGGRQWSLVIANILAHILIDLMPDLRAALAPNGRLILSGLITEQEPEMVATLKAHGLTIQERHTQEDWVALVVTIE